MGRCPTLQTERLLLRPFEEANSYAAMLPSEPVRNVIHLPHGLGRWDVWR